MYIFIYSLAGYETAQDILNIDENKIYGLEMFATTIPQIVRNLLNMLKVKIAAMCERNILCLFLGMYANEAGSFKFKIGEIVLIKQAIGFGKRMLEINNHSYDVFQFNNGEKRSTVTTPIGEFFGYHNWELKPREMITNGTFIYFYPLTRCFEKIY